MSPGIDDERLQCQAARTRQKFLKDGDRVKVTVRFRGREMAHTNIGEQLLTQFGEPVCRDRHHGQETQSWRDGHMFMFLSPKAPDKQANPKT